MNKSLLPTALTAVVLLLGGCVVEAGYDARSTEYGVATRANQVAQDAYGLSNERLRDLGKDFSSNTQDTVTFDFNRSNLDAAARTALDGQAKWLRARPGVRMTIIGHTDLVGSNSYNNRLGLRRARAVLRYLTRKGVSRRRLAAIASRGEREPVVQTEERERRNRRTITTVSGFYRNYVGTGLDGEYAARVYDGYQAGKVGVTAADSTAIN